MTPSKVEEREGETSIHWEFATCQHKTMYFIQGLIGFSQWSYEVCTVMTPILQMRKLRLEQFSHVHVTRKVTFSWL